jgi:hypothetical protein
LPNVVLTNLELPDLDKMVEAKIFSFLKKLRADDTTAGLHIEKMANPADPRARTGRVDRGWRAVLYRIETSDRERTYVYAGTYPHDTANDYAKTRVLKYNPINGVAELIQSTTPHSASIGAGWAPLANKAECEESYLQSRFNYALKDLTDVLGFDSASASSLLAATDEAGVLAVGEGFENAWQQLAAVGLAVGDTLDKIRDDLGLEPRAPEPHESDDDILVRALGHPAAKMQFTFVETDDEMRRIIEGGDFGAWRVFLHPEQQRYATGHWQGPFRLTGGAGTGKTVVLLHRTKHLAQQSPESRIILATFTRALAENLKRDLGRLDPSLPAAAKLGESGVLIRGVDQLATAVRFGAGAGFGAAARAVLGEALSKVDAVVANDVGWSRALTATDPDLPAPLRTTTFFESEYQAVILPARILSSEEYLEVRRPGRGIPLDRGKRLQVWNVVEAYRKAARSAGSITWAEQAAIAALWLDVEGDRAGILADHLLVDEGQDLSPAHWQFLRALVKPGADDLFIAEDTHQRIYGRHVVLSRYGIRIIGRSRRLTLNYRTTEQNLMSALRVLEGAQYTDAENDVEDVLGYRSARRGPLPIMVPTASESEMVTHIAELISSWLAEGIVASTVALLARTNDRAVWLRDRLNESNIATNLIKHANAEGDRPVVLTMHTAKGMEFSRVILVDISDGAVPLASALRDLPDEEREDALLRERSLLYVAATRARDVLAIAWCGEPSSLLGIAGRGSNPMI